MPQEAYVLKVRMGSDTWVKPDGTVGTAGKGALIEREVTFTLATRQDQTLFQPSGGGYVVRRLTPTETERLQGMPDGYTDLTGCDVKAVTDKVAESLGYDEGQKAKLRRNVQRWSNECPDGPRYRCTGNSFAVPVVGWIGSRLQMVQEIIDETEGADEAPNSYGEQSREGVNNG